MAVGWSAEDSATQLTTINNTTRKYFDDLPQLGANQYAHVWLKVNSSGTTNNAIISIFATTDETPGTPSSGLAAGNWDSTPITSFTITATSGNDETISVIIKDVYKFCVGVLSSGATDTFTADMTHRIATMS